jgi:hypothetical protein
VVKSNKNVITMNCSQCAQKKLRSREKLLVFFVVVCGGFPYIGFVSFHCRKHISDRGYMDDNLKRGPYTVNF